jgi:transposase-like protein
MRQVNAALLQVYLSGANTRWIRWALKPLLAGGPLSTSTISRIVQGLKAGLVQRQLMRRGERRGQHLGGRPRPQ